MIRFFDSVFLVLFILAPALVLLPFSINDSKQQERDSAAFLLAAARARPSCSCPAFLKQEQGKLERARRRARRSCSCATNGEQRLHGRERKRRIGSWCSAAAGQTWARTSTCAPILLLLSSCNGQEHEARESKASLSAHVDVRVYPGPAILLVPS